MSKCPSCKSDKKKRISRVFPKIKIYKCHECRTKYIKVPFLISSIILKK